MTDKSDKTGAGARQDRLKTALRENLKRRKLQARERSSQTDPPSEDEASADEVITGETGE